MPVFALVVCSALCFDEDDRRMIHDEICVRFEYRCTAHGVILV